MDCCDFKRCKSDEECSADGMVCRNYIISFIISVMTNIILIIFSLALPTVVGGKTAKRVAAEGEVTIFSIIIDTKGKEACGEVIKINYYKSSFTLYAFHCVDLLTKHIAINTWWVHSKKSRGRRHG